MELEIKKQYSTAYLIVKDTNVHIEEDVSETFYHVGEDGKTDFSKRLRSDITDDAMKKVLTFAEDLIYYRESNYDSSALIEQCFYKLPQETAVNLIKKLTKEYVD